MSSPARSIGTGIGQRLAEFVAAFDRKLTAEVPGTAPRGFSLRDVARKIGYDIRYLLARTKHPAR